MSSENNFLEVGLQGVEKAAEILHDFYKRANTLFIGHKNKFFDSGSLVSEADIASQNAITQLLLKEFPEHGIWGEEETNVVNFKNEYTWYIDPLDGTSNFLRNIPIWGISVALVKDNEPIVGILNFPELGICLTGSKGGGAFADGKQIHVSNRDIHEGLYWGRSYYGGKSYFKDNLASKFGLTKVFDSSAYELAQVAIGNAELYTLVNIPHDTAAGALFVQEAGGKVTDINGQPWNIESKDIVASNGRVHDKVLRILATGN